MEITTKYGVFSEAYNVDFYPEGGIKECMFDSCNAIPTALGVLTPKYSSSDARDKYCRSVSFYPSGNLKSIYLDERLELTTPLGTLQTELVTFYESGKIRRLFPSNAKLSAYWSAKDEAAMIKETELHFPFGSFYVKVNCLHFYESGILRSLSLWEGQRIEVETPVATVPTRIGFSLYEDGSLQSIEPAVPVKIPTPIGTISACHPNPSGIHADQNTLEFYHDGSVKCLSTYMNLIRITDLKGSHEFHPEWMRGLLDPEQHNLVPIQVSFDEYHFIITNADHSSFYFKLYSPSCIIQISTYLTGPDSSGCSDCSQCSKCSSSAEIKPA